eukprot:jgi/Chrzof1/761/Cz01g27200.t1
MGSLTPGWNSAMPGAPPKEYADYLEGADEDLASRGYFACYNRQKSLRRASQPESEFAEDPVFGSAPSGAAAAPSIMRTLSLSRRPVHSVTSPESPTGISSRGSVPTARQFNRSLTGTNRDDDEFGRMDLRRASMPDTYGGRRSLSMSPKKADLPASRLDSYKTSKTAQQASQWWRKLSSAALNELGEQEEERSKAFKPQHHITGQHLNFRSDTDADNPHIIPAHA